MSVLGMNRRNALIAKVNPRHAIARANNKYATKTALAGRGVPVIGTVAFIKDRLSLETQELAERLPDAFAMKPNRGGQGRGILLIERRDGEDWYDNAGRAYSLDDIKRHARRILDAEFSLPGVHRDQVLIERLIKPAQSMTRLVNYGLPDVRLICREDDVLLAMMRLPTVNSGGRANLHRGAVGAALDLRDGTIYRAALCNHPLETHPDTGASLKGYRVPHWDEILEAARNCAAPMGLGYLGADIIIDEHEGVKVVEVNAFPGLEIQNVCGAGLRDRIEQASHARKAGLSLAASRAPVSDDEYEREVA